MFQVGQELRERGHAISYGGRENSIFLEKCTKAAFPVLPLKTIGNLPLRTIRKLQYYFHEQKIDVVVAEYNRDIRLAGIAARWKGGSLLVARTGLPSLKNNLGSHVIFPHILDGIIVPTRAIQEKYTRLKWLNPSLIRVIPNGLTPAPLPETSIEEMKKRFDLPLNRQVIGIFSKLKKEKQHLIFLEVAANILKDFEDCLFLIVGDGPERDKIKKYAFDLGILDHVYMPGFQDEVLPLYTLCDIILLTSQEEGMPSSVMEAMLMGRVVVAFDVGGVSDLIISERNGILVPPNDIYMMSQQVKQLLMDVETRQLLGAQAREDMIRDYGLKKMIDEIENYLKEQLSKKRGEFHGA
ncbi:MAG: hypothetical protein Kow0042_17440 [Calditrichia bacterium]